MNGPILGIIQDEFVDDQDASRLQDRRCPGHDLPAVFRSFSVKDMGQPYGVIPLSQIVFQVVPGPEGNAVLQAETADCPRRKRPGGLEIEDGCLKAVVPPAEMDRIGPRTATQIKEALPSRQVDLPDDPWRQAAGQVEHPHEETLPDLPVPERRSLPDRPASPHGHG